jgi:hypothetical protein
VEEALLLLPALEPDRLKLSPESLNKLKNTILDDARGEGWLQAKVLALECGDGIRFEDLMS